MNSKVLIDQASGYFNACLGVGEAFGPIFASIMVSKVGFRHAEDVWATTIFGYLVFYFIILGNFKLLRCLPD